MLRYILRYSLPLILLPIIIFARNPVSYVVNGTGETLSKINLETGVVENNILTLGSDVLCYPTQIVVRDTLAYVLNSGTNEIQIIDLNTETTVAFINVGADFSPFWMAFLDSQFVYVTSFTQNNVARVDVINESIVSQTPVGISPEGIIIRDFKAYIAITAFDHQTWEYGQGKVVVFDTHTDTVIEELDVGTNPQYLACDSLGRIHVVCTGDYWSSFGMIYIINADVDVVVDSFSIGGSPGNITISPDNIAYLAAGGWVGDGYVYTYNALSGQMYHPSDNPLVVDSGCMMTVAWQDTTVFVGTFKDYVTEIDSAGNSLQSFALGDGPIYADFNYLPGDLTGNFQVDITDLIWMVNWFFTGGPPALYPRWRANVDGNEQYNIADLVYFTSYMFMDGPPPKIGINWLN